MCSDDELESAVWAGALTREAAAFRAHVAATRATTVKRQTRKADVAFWLHLLAAPLVVPPRC